MATPCDAHAACTCTDQGPGRLRWLGTIAPVLACAVCPACLSTYASILSALGVGVTFTETEHHVLLAVAVTIAVVVGGWRTWRERRWTPLVIAAAGCALLVAGHAGEVAWLEWTGLAVLIVGPMLAGLRRRSAQRSRSIRPAALRRAA